MAKKPVKKMPMPAQKMPGKTKKSMC